MKILLFGKNGQLGWNIHRTLLPLGEVYTFPSSELNITQFDKLREVIRRIKPDVIVNASAYTDVDLAETESDLAMAVNAIAPGIMAEEAYAIKSVLIHFSTDYVFDGKKEGLYNEDDNTNPLNVYGQSKLKGEQSIIQVRGAYIILRTSWVYSLRGNCFVSKVLKWARNQSILRVVEDQIGSPTWARTLGDTTSLMLARGGKDFSPFLNDRTGIYHLGGFGVVSRLEFAREILRLDPNHGEQVFEHLEPALTSDFPTPAIRPLNTAIDCSKFTNVFGLYLPNWKNALSFALGG